MFQSAVVLLLALANLGRNSVVARQSDAQPNAKHEIGQSPRRNPISFGERVDPIQSPQTIASQRERGFLEPIDPDIVTEFLDESRHLFGWRGRMTRDRDDHVAASKFASVGDNGFHSKVMKLQNESRRQFKLLAAGCVQQN